METNMLNKILNTFTEHPLATSLLVCDLAILALHKPPFLFSVLMLVGLIVLSMFIGQKMAIFK